MISSYWQQFIERYSSQPDYWYVNKRLALTKGNVSIIQRQLKILAQFEGKEWNKQLQTAYRNLLLSHNLIVRRATEQRIEDANASVRMLKVIFDTLGLAWVNDNTHIELTKVGSNLISESNPEEVLANQIRRYEFWNPSIDRAIYKKIALYPYYFLIQLLLNSAIKYLTRDEYALFVSRARNHEDVETVIDQIARWRDLSEEEQAKIKEGLDSILLMVDTTGTLPLSEELDVREKHQPIYKTIVQNAPYSMNFYTFPSEFSYKDGRVQVYEKNVDKLKRYLVEFQRAYTYISFKTEKDWFAFYGDPENTPLVDRALMYYSDISDVERAIETYKSAKLQNKKSATVSTITEEEFVDEIILERMIEDYLEYNIESLENGLRLVEHGRQFSTLVGPIDLLAKDSSNNYVVIELKRGRTSDTVFGQISRYIGWTLKNLVRDQQVRGIIVGKTIDDNLRLAILNSRSRINLYSFNFQIDFSPIPETQ